MRLVLAAVRTFVPVSFSRFRDVIRLLRIPFSFFLLPVFLLSLMLTQSQFSSDVLLVFVTWHLLVFPASNGYNSWHDRDSSPVGTLQHPPVPPSVLLPVVNSADLTALFLAAAVSNVFCVMVFVYILASRLYSHRRTRIKKYPFISFGWVSFFQGGWVFAANCITLGPGLYSSQLLWGGLLCIFTVATMYPITQIYQHEADEADGVRTISMLAGVNGTFRLAAAMYAMLLLCLYYALGPGALLLFALITSPALIYFLSWAVVCARNPAAADYRRTMRMLVVSSLLTNLCYLLLIVDS